MLQNIQRLVERSYVDGRPKHHLPSARDPTFTPGSSIFFITDHADLGKYSKADLQRIARDRHIVVQNAPQDDFEWDRETLALLGNLKLLREIQGTFDKLSRNVSRK